MTDKIGTHAQLHATNNRGVWRDIQRDGTGQERARFVEARRWTRPGTTATGPPNR
jgi:hypothetical protein